MRVGHMTCHMTDAWFIVMMFNLNVNIFDFFFFGKKDILQTSTIFDHHPHTPRRVGIHFLNEISFNLLKQKKA